MFLNYVSWHRLECEEGAPTRKKKNRSSQSVIVFIFGKLMLNKSSVVKGGFRGALVGQ